MRFPGFIGGAYHLSSKNVDCQRCINLYPEVNELGKGKALEVLSLRGTPGLSLLATVGTGVGRGNYRSSDGKLFKVTGNKLYRVSNVWVATEIGTLTTSEGQVSFADNGTHLVVVDGINGYTHELAGASLVQISDPDFPGASHVGYIDGYFIFTEPDSGRFFISDLNAITIPGDIATSEGLPDNVISMLCGHRELWLFNEVSTEVFYNSGNADFPFERINGAFIEYGIAAEFSAAKLGDTTFWLGRNEDGSGVVLQAQGYQPKRISTHAIEVAIQGYAEISDAIAMTYESEGHFFYQLSFPTGNATWVFDMSTNLWHERAYSNEGILERHRSYSHAFVFGKHIVDDWENGKLYEMTKSAKSDNLNPLRRIRVSPHFSEGGKRLFYSEFELDIEMGVGLDGGATVQGHDPQAMLKFSNDGGHTWSNELWRSFGKIGQKKRRAKWNRLGQARDRVFWLEVADPVDVTFIGAELAVEQGAS